MAKPRRQPKSNKDVYEKAEDLPEIKKKAYDSILEDFEKQVASRIEQINSSVDALTKQITSQFRAAKFRLPKSVRDEKVEDFYYQDGDTEDAISDKLNMTIELAKVAVEITKEVSNEVQNNVKAKGKKKSTRPSKKKSSILSQGPDLAATGLRRSSRKRSGKDSWIPETPLASSTLTAASLGFTTVKSTRSKPKMPFQTPFGGTNGLPTITPKFDPNTPLTKTAMRTQRADEKFLVSMNGSPVYVAKGKSKTKDNFIPVPMGNGKTLVVPADNPEVQPHLQSLINSCLKIMNKK